MTEPLLSGVVARHHLVFEWPRRASMRRRVRFVLRHWRRLGVGGVWFILRRGRGGVTYPADEFTVGTFWV